METFSCFTCDPARLWGCPETGGFWLLAKLNSNVESKIVLLIQGKKILLELAFLCACRSWSPLAEQRELSAQCDCKRRSDWAVLLSDIISNCNPVVVPMVTCYFLSVPLGSLVFRLLHSCTGRPKLHSNALCLPQTGLV